jgi:hypothetical protein
MDTYKGIEGISGIGEPQTIYKVGDGELIVRQGHLSNLRGTYLFQATKERDLVDVISESIFKKHEELHRKTHKDRSDEDYNRGNAFFARNSEGNSLVYGSELAEKMETDEEDYVMVNTMAGTMLAVGAKNKVRVAGMPALNTGKAGVKRKVSVSAIADAPIKILKEGGLKRVVLYAFDTTESKTYQHDVSVVEERFNQLLQIDCLRFLE